MTWETFTNEQLESAIKDARRTVTKRRERLATAEANLARLLEIQAARARRDDIVQIVRTKKVRP